MMMADVDAKSSQPPGDDESTGLPALPSWRVVYTLVAVIFVVYVVLLRLLMRVYS
jgi:hypothetical protein